MKTVHFSDDDLSQVSNAARVAEKTTSSEIVSCVVQASSDYEEGPLWAFMISILIYSAAMVAIESGWGLGYSSVALIGVGIAISLGAFQLARSSPEVRRLFILRDRMHMASKRRADLAFYENGVMKTRNRTGLLIFVSLFERQIHLKADEGLSVRVSSHEWQSVIDQMTQLIKENKPTEGFIRGIELCGEILKRVSPAGVQNDNELSNKLVQDKNS